MTGAFHYYEEQEIRESKRFEMSEGMIEPPRDISLQQFLPPEQEQRLGFAWTELGILVRKAELILGSLHPWVHPQIQVEIDQWFWQKERCILFIQNPPQEQLPPTGRPDHHNHTPVDLEVEEVKSQDHVTPKSVSMSADDEEGSDSEEDFEEDESSGSNTEALVQNLNVKFKEVLDEKISEAEGFFDHQDFIANVISDGTCPIPGEPSYDFQHEKEFSVGGNPLNGGEDEDDLQSVQSADESHQRYFSVTVPKYISKLNISRRCKSEGILCFGPFKNLEMGQEVVPARPRNINFHVKELESIFKMSQVDSAGVSKSGFQLTDKVESSLIQLMDTIRTTVSISQPPEFFSETEQSNVEEKVPSPSATIDKNDTDSQGETCPRSFIHVESQTDVVAVDANGIVEIGDDKDIARGEITHLRDTKTSLILQRKALSDKIKQSSSHDSMKGDEKRLYEFEEAIEAIDTAIEYKNEIICGKRCILSNQAAPGKTEADLVTRLTSLCLQDLQRLLCTYFAKVVELRYSSRKLEKMLDKLETDKEKLSRRVALDQKFMKEKDAETDSRIKHLLSQCNKDPHSAFDSHLRTLEKSLTAAKRKQYDLERSLTELLVRHGYLLNGADYDVKQVVRMLGIDTTQMDLDKGRAGISPRLLPALDHVAQGQGLSRRMKEAFSQRRNAQSSSHFLLPLFEPSRRSHHHHHQSHHHSSRPPDHQGTDFVGTEVRRGKKKLIIQPSQPQASTSHNHHYS